MFRVNKLYKKYKSKFLNSNNILCLYLFFLNLYLYINSNLDPSLIVFYALCWSGIFLNIKLNDSNKNRLTFFLTIVLVILLTIKSFSIHNHENHFIFISLLSSVFIVNFFNSNSFNFFNDRILIFLGSLQTINYLLMPYLSVFLQILTSKISNFILNFIGINSIQKSFYIYYEPNVIEVNTGCSGYIQLFFTFTALFIFYKVYPISNKLNLFFIINFSIFIPIILNAFRIFLLSIFIFIDTQNGKILFDFFHESMGSIIFSGFSVYFTGNYYLKIIEKEKKIKFKS